MKHLFVGILILSIWACDDGDLKIETIDFDDIELITTCDEPATIASQLFFKINGDEALILELEGGFLDQGEIITESVIPSRSKLTYRLFNGDVSENYFCDEIPPKSPNVIEEIEAEDGLVLLETTLNTAGDAYIHKLRLSDITFVNDVGERITDLRVTDFGEVITAVPE